MTGADTLGWCAATLTLLTFAARDMRLLRMAALAANLCFIAYAGAAHLWPVLALHVLLVPLNLLRLLELGRMGAPRTVVTDPPQGETARRSNARRELLSDPEQPYTCPD